MGSDRARVSYDPTRHYRSVVMQQGRVTLEADWNEAETIAEEELRHETLEIVGPAGTPDGGYQVKATGNGPHPTFDFAISKGTAYVDGLRLSLDDDVDYATQPDWLDNSTDEPDFVPPDKPAGKTSNELIYLFIREQEVSAVEDNALRDVALGGPDTAQRTRMIQRIARLSTEFADCASAIKALDDYWGSKGLAFHQPATMRLNSQATLRASFPDGPQKPDPCEPEAVGGYLGADNQLIRIQITGQNTLVWGFDDASFLYRVTIIDSQTLKLQSQPVDAFHQPQAGQAVEVLRSAALLSNGEYVAAATGVVQTLNVAYNQDTMQITQLSPLPSYFTDGSTPQAFLRVWQQQLTFTRGTAIELGTTGLFVTLGTKVTVANTHYPFHVGDYWLIAVRPSTPTELYPRRYREGAQPPDGPRMWACPLAAIHWDKGALNVDEQCLPPFDNLVDLTKHRGTGCCTVSVSPADLAAGKTLQSVLDGVVGRGPAKICLGPGTYNLTAPLVLGQQHSNFTIEACPGSVTLQAAQGSDANFQQGLVTLAGAKNVTFRGLTFDLLPAPIRSGTGSEAVQIPGSAGLRPVDCSNLSVEDCAFEFPVGVDPALRSPPTVAGILAGGECSGFRLVGNRFEVPVSGVEHPVDFMVGFAVFPSSMLQSPPGTNAAVTAKFVGSWLDDALLRDNFFGPLNVPVWVYADCGLVKLESNTVRGSSNGFIFGSMLSFASTFNMANVAVDEANVETAVQLHNALFYTLANPSLQIAIAALRGFPLPANFDLAKAQTITPGPGAATDISGVQDLFDRVLPAAPAPAALPAPPAPPPGRPLPARIPLSGNHLTLRQHPLASAQPVPANLTALNQTFSAIENQAFAAAAAPTTPVALQIAGNDVDADTGNALFIEGLSTDGRDALNLAGNNFISVSSAPANPTANIAGVSRCTITSNVILNEASSTNGPPSSLWVAATNGAITGNVLRGKAVFAVPPPTQTPPLDNWNVFNSFSST